jgi:putative transposase
MLAVMRWIDELHLPYPVAGARMRRDLLRREGHAIGRR